MGRGVHRALKNTPQILLVEHDDIMAALAPDASDDPLLLPGHNSPGLDELKSLLPTRPEP
jgi:hypothetical protein